MFQHHERRLTRRRFLKLGGAALAGVALAGCRGPKHFELTAVQPLVNPAFQLAPTLAPGQFADTILVNGNIVTMDARRTTVKALAVKQGRILMVGEERAVRSVSGANTKIVDLRGRTVTPGLIDAHCHLSACGLLGTAYVDVSWPARFLRSRRCRPRSRNGSPRRHPASGWSVWVGVTFDGRNPTKHDLDPVSPKHPVNADQPGRAYGRGQQPGPRDGRCEQRHAGPGKRSFLARGQRRAQRHDIEPPGHGPFPPVVAARDA